MKLKKGGGKFPRGTFEIGPLLSPEINTDILYAIV